MKSGFLTALTISLLLASAVWLAVLVKKERTMGEHEAMTRTAVRGGNLRVIVRNGHVEPRPMGDQHLTYVFLFVVHRQVAESDIAYWNSVVDWAREARPDLRGAIEYWGVCDSGAECNGYSSAARFSIVGYLDLSEMHVLASRDALHLSVLYDKRHRAERDIMIQTDPSTTANLLLRSLK
jgi:hypothetical protein